MRAPAPQGFRGWWLSLTAVAAGVAVLPLLLNGCSCGQDFDFHMVSWLEAASQMRHGVLHPQWAYSPAYNAGEPRFIFYPPLSWMIGAVIGLVLTHLPGLTAASGWQAAPVVFTWLALTGAGLTCYRFLQELGINRSTALVASVAYLVNPYMLFTAFERTAYAELLAASWVPLLLLGILRTRVTVSAIAVPVALLWLTNAPAGVMGSYTVLVLGSLRLIWIFGGGRPGFEAGASHNRTKQALSFMLKTSSGVLLGLALAGFYIIPAAYERGFVQAFMATIADLRFDRNFLFEKARDFADPFHNQVLHTVSAVSVLLLGTAIAALVTCVAKSVKSAERRRFWDSEPVSRTIWLLLVSCGILFLLTPWSDWIWQHTPELPFLQFPWRWLMIAAPIAAFAIAHVIEIPESAWSVIATAVILASGMVVPSYHSFRQGCEVTDLPKSHLADFVSHAGVEPTDEYTPVTADNDALKPHHPPYWLARAPGAEPSEATNNTVGLRGPTPAHFSIYVPEPEYLILNLRDYPAWQILRNGTVDYQRAGRDDGLIALPVPKGAWDIQIRYRHLRDHLVGHLISGLACVVLLVSLTRKTPEASPR